MKFSFSSRKILTLLSLTLLPILFSCSRGQPLSITTTGSGESTQNNPAISSSTAKCVLDTTTVSLSLVDQNQSFVVQKDIRWDIRVSNESHCNGPFKLADSSGVKTGFQNGFSTIFIKSYANPGQYQEQFVVSDDSGASFIFSTGYFQVSATATSNPGAFSCLATVDQVSRSVLANQNNDPIESPQFNFTIYSAEESRLLAVSGFQGSILSNPNPVGNYYTVTIAINKFGTQNINFILENSMDSTRTASCSSVINVVKLQPTTPPPNTVQFQFSAPKLLGSLPVGTEIRNARINAGKRSVVGITFNNEFWISDVVNPTFVKATQIPGTFLANMVQLADLNGDGYDDIVQQTSDNRFLAQFSTGGGNFAVQSFLLKHGGTGLPESAKYADVNGDGKLDLIYQGTDNKFWLSLSDGTQLATPTLVAQHGGGFEPKHSAYYADTTGDGKADLIYLDAYTQHFYLGISNGTLFQSPIDAFTAPNLTWLTAQNLVPPVFGDFDGDGKKDLATAQFDGVTWHYYITYSKGNLFSAGTQMGTDIAASTFAGDLDANNRDEFIMITNTGNVTYYDGTSLKPSTQLPNYSGGFIKDMNGDSRADIVYWNSNMEIWYLENTK